MSRKSLLVAGFGAFPGQRINPAQIAVEVLTRRRAAFALSGIDLHTAVLPVDHAELPPQLTRLFAETSPEAVLLLGVAARRKALSIETRARNRVTLLRADAVRRLAWSREIAHGAPDPLTSPAPVERLAAAARACGVPAQASRDAGAYLCNEAYYLSLLMDRRAVFVHLPDWRRADVARALPALESLAKALTFMQD